MVSLSSGGERVRERVRFARQRGWLVIVPAIVIAEVTRGRPEDHAVNRTLDALVAGVRGMQRDRVFVSINEQLARLAGRLMWESNMSGHTVDAAVAVDRQPAEILTGDWDDLARLTDGYNDVRVWKI